MKKILYIDLDGVIADFDSELELIQPGIAALAEEDRGRLVHEICKRDPEFFQNLPLFEGAKESVHLLLPLFDVYFLSTPMWDVSHSFSGKCLWLEKQFGEKVRKRLILSHRKDLQIGDYLVDDRKRHGSEKFIGEFIHFGQFPFKTWKDTLGYLLQKAEFEI